MRTYLETSGDVSSKLLVKDGKIVGISKSRTASPLAISTWRALFISVFLPKGFPSSVSAEYISYQSWDTVQALASSLSGALATEAVLRGAGVGNKSATALAASMTWLVRDGVSMLGRILFSYLKGSELDANCKRWRLVADICVDVSYLLDLLSPLFPQLFLPLACTSSLLRCIVIVAGGATKMAMVHHLAVYRNVADVAAKDSCQETLVHGVAVVLSLVLLPLVHGRSLLVWTLFAAFTAIHLYGNYRAVRSLHLRSLNSERAIVAIRHFLSSSTVPSVEECNLREPLFVLPCSRIHLGCSLSHLLNRISSSSRFHETSMYTSLVDCTSSWIALRSGSTTQDQLEALFHVESIVMAKENAKFADFLGKLTSANYDLKTIQLCSADWRYDLIE